MTQPAVEANIDAALRTGHSLLVDALREFASDLRVESLIVSWHFQDGKLNHADGTYERSHDPECQDCRGAPGAADSDIAWRAIDQCARLCLPICFRSGYFGMLLIRLQRDETGISATAQSKRVLKGQR